MDSKLHHDIKQENELQNLSILLIDCPDRAQHYKELREHFEANYIELLALNDSDLSSISLNKRYS